MLLRGSAVRHPYSIAVSSLGGTVPYFTRIGRLGSISFRRNGSVLAPAGAARECRPAYNATRSHRLPRVLASAAVRRTTGVGQGTLQQQQQSYSSWQQLQQRQQQGQMTGSPLLAAYSQVSTLNHPSTIPLQLEDNAVRDAAGNVLLDNINSNLVTLNSRESQHGALVLGASSEHGPASCWDLTVGKLKFKRYLACARNKLWWMTPEWGTSLHTLPPETQFLLLELDDGAAAVAANGSESSSSSNGSAAAAPRYALVVPLIDGDFRGTLRPNRSWSDRQGSLCLRVESGDDSRLGESCDSVLLLACSSDPFHLVDAGVAAAAALSGGAAPRASKQLPNSLDGFGWCTWDAFYSTVSARGLLEGLDSLATGGVSPQLLIIDDGWQLTDVDPPYGKAPTAQLADKLVTDDSPAKEFLEGPKEMVLTTQDTFYQENAKLMAEASELMQQEVRNLFPTVANTGAIAHHHTPPAASWDAPADAAAAEKEEQIASSMSQDYQQQQGDRPDWAQQRGTGSNKSAAKAKALREEREKRALLHKQQKASSSSNSNKGTVASEDGVKAAADEANLTKERADVLINLTRELNKLPQEIQKLPKEIQREVSHLVEDSKQAVEESSEMLKLRAAEAAAEAEARLEQARLDAEEQLKRAIKKASPSPRQQFILIRWAQKVAGALVGVATAGFLLFYQWVVEPAPPNSLRVKAFAALTQGVLRGAMLTFFASASDFTRRLTSVEANAKFSRLDAGPEEDWEATAADLRAVVMNIKQRFGVRYVYCWHGLPAYWGGIMPGTPALTGVTGAQLVYPKPTNSIAEVEPSLLWSPAVLAGVGVAQNPYSLYSAMHSYLAGSAVDGVKVDCQAGVGLVGSVLGGGPAAARQFQAALEDSIAQHFPGNHAINCMCHSSENFYRFSRTAVARVSDDYYPRDPASSTPHIGACAFNSVYLGALVQPDWDMFQSAHPAGVLHGMARAVSGGAVYVSDKPGQHDFSLLRKLVLPDGSILRALLPGRPTRDCLFTDVLRDRHSLLKVWNVNPVVGVVGVFNLQGSSWDRTRRKFHQHDKRGQRLETIVTPDDVEPFRLLPAAAAAAAGNGAGVDSNRWAGAAAAAGVNGATGSSNGNGAGDAAATQQQQQQQREFAMYRYITGEMTVSSSSSSSEGVPVALDAAKSDLVWVSPIQQAAGYSFAPLGLLDMFNGGGSVLRCVVNRGSNSSSATAAAANESSDRVSRGAVVAAAAAGGAGKNGPAAVAAMQIKGCGRFLAYSSAQPARVLVNFSPHNFNWDEYTQRLEFEVPHTDELLHEVEVLYQ